MTWRELQCSFATAPCCPSRAPPQPLPPPQPPRHTPRIRRTLHAPTNLCPFLKAECSGPCACPCTFPCSTHLPACPGRAPAARSARAGCPAAGPAQRTGRRGPEGAGAGGRAGDRQVTGRGVERGQAGGGRRGGKEAAPTAAGWLGWGGGGRHTRRGMCPRGRGPCSLARRRKCKCPPGMWAQQVVHAQGWEGLAGWLVADSCPRAAPPRPPRLHLAGAAPRGPSGRPPPPHAHVARGCAGGDVGAGGVQGGDRGVRLGGAQQRQHHHEHEQGHGRAEG